MVGKNEILVKELQSNLNKLMDSLIQDVSEIERIIEKWKQPFYNYSFFNICLLYSQMPDFTQVASYKRWQDNKRQVKRGSSSLRVLAPVIYKKTNEKTGEEEEKMFFKPVPVFDVSQTEGEPLNFTKNNGLTKSNKEWDLNQLISNVEVPVSYRTMKPRGQTDGKQIWLSNELEQDSDRICTLIHEKAHIELDHVIDPDKSYAEKELEAETISFIVSSAMNIVNDNSKAYISHFWKDNPEKELDVKGTELIKLSYKIYNQLIK